MALLGLFNCANAERPNILLCVADDHSYEHTSAVGAEFVKTPAFDRIAESGVLFKNAFASAPSCAPSRAAILMGRPFFLTQSAVMNHGFWPVEVAPFPSLLQDAGYRVGFTGKGWGPGQYEREDLDNAAGNEYNDRKASGIPSGLSSSDYAANFQKFLGETESSEPFFFWFGPSEPHRPIEEGIGERMGLDVSKVRVPDYYPDVDVVRNDILDYGYEIQYYDGYLERMLEILEERGELDRTIVLATSDHGMAFPRAKTSVYDAGLRVPLAVMWKASVQAGRSVDDFVNLYDLAPTLLQLAGIESPRGMIGQSLAPLLTATGSGRIDPERDHSIGGLERHGGVRTGGPDYPSRTFRNSAYHFIKNYSPENPPAGPPVGTTWPRDDPVGGYGYVDGCPTKTALFELREVYPTEFQLCLEKRPMYELYDVRTDPDQVDNLAYKPKYKGIVNELETRMELELVEMGDPRLTGDPGAFERVRRQILERLEE